MLTTDQASDAAIEDADLIVAGAPVIAFGLASDTTRDNLVTESSKAPSAPDLSHPTMRSWLDHLPPGRGRSAAFEKYRKGEPTAVVYNRGELDVVVRVVDANSGFTTRIARLRALSGNR